MTLRELVIAGPDGQTRTVALNGEKLSLGRSSTNELCYPDDSGLSRQHLVFERSGEGWAVRDLDSKNGTQVNGVRIKGSHVLQPGDRVMAGHLVIQQKTEEPITAMQTVFFVAEPPSPVSTTVETSLEGVLGAEKGTPGAAALTGLNSIQALIRAGQELSSQGSLAELFPLILDLSISAVGATRALLMILEKDELVVRAAHGKDFQISRAVRDRVINGKASLLVQDAQFDAELAGRHSIVMQGMRSIMAVPLQTRDRVIGLIYVDTQNLIRPFTQEDLNLLTVMANVAAIRIEQARLAEIEQNERIFARELAQAAEIQRGLLPADAPKIAGIDLDGRNLPCHGVGGDYYDYFPYPDGRVGIVVADVAGKGMPAAMMMSNMQAHMQVYTETFREPAEVVARLNRSLAARCPGNRFITFFLALLDPKTGQMTYCNAGHNPPILIRKNGSVEQLAGGGMILGIFGGAEYENQAVTLEDGDLLALFSDGVTEACQPSLEEEFGEDRLTALLAENISLPATKVIEKVMEKLNAWGAGEAFADDVTLVVVRRVAGSGDAAPADGLGGARPFVLL
jgi:serine phosphatase RsbU (regulator of sigma subunit)/pSer/pThr/pTyr-binding forkhead associated (FHA) protein